MKEQHVLVDYENVQPTLEQLAKLAPGFTDAWLFHGPHQVKPVQQLAAAHERMTLVPRSGKGKNALDFHLSFYLGYVAAKHPEAILVVVANDRGYDPMIAHAKSLGFQVRRVGFKARKGPAAKKTTAVLQPAVAKKVAPAAKPTSPKKMAPAQKGVAKKAPAKKTPAAKAVASSAPAKKTTAKAATPARRTQAKTPAPAKKVALPKAAATSDSKELARVKKGLAKMGDKAPHKLKPFLRHLESMLGKASTPAALEALVKRLEQETVVRVEGDKVFYG